ncbi:MAG: DNA-binding protein [Bacteroidales bacterium]|nr:DNA-binding protein [Bacteroidales bacterium]MCF8455278.1 DNA-binding protein [Bacteroidales bacterium]
MAKKKAFVIRIDPEKLAAIEKWAADEFRSSNGQLEWIIDKALRDAGRLKKSGEELSK